MINPFPIPAKFQCPYCHRMGNLEGFDDKTSIVRYVCGNQEYKEVSNSRVSVWTKHTFYAIWRDEKWQLVDCSCCGSKEIEEHVDAKDGWTIVKGDLFEKAKEHMVKL